jgi:uncharacterized membrane protein YobD (UPF0266 family)
MDKNKEEPLKGEHYSDEDKKLIISLLGEYSEKLLIICDRISRRQRITQLLTTFFVSVLALIFSLATTITFPLITSLESFFFFSTCFLEIFLLEAFYENKRALLLLQRDAKRISLKLEKIIRIASQAQEHILNDFVSRIEMDLRLADAESALDHYSFILKSSFIKHLRRRLGFAD